MAYNREFPVKLKFEEPDGEYNSLALMHRHDLTQQPEIKRDTLRNLFRLIRRGDTVEILKVLRRRSLNTFKFVRRLLARLVGLVYDLPTVQKKRQQRQLKYLLSKNYEYSVKDVPDAKVKIALILRDGDTYPKSSAFIRLISPLTDNAVKDEVAIQLFPGNTIELPEIYDVCIIQRTAIDDIDSAKQLVSDIRQKNIKLVIDNDDAFNIIDPTHPEHNEHKERIEALNYLAQEADECWLSVPRLSNTLPASPDKIRIIPNSLDLRLWQKKNQHNRYISKSALKFLYMGTVSHDADLEMILPALESTAKKFPGAFELTIIGVASVLPDYPWVKRLYQPRGSSIYPKFVRWFLKQGPFDIGLSPLVDSKFNRAKSDIKCLDYLSAGIIPVVSDIEPYQTKELDPYIIKVKNSTRDWEETFERYAEDVMRFRKLQKDILPKAQSYISQQRSSTVTSKQMLDYLNKILKNT